MNTIDHIVKRAIAAPFYRQHAGAFLFLFLILFGIQPSIYDALKLHYALIVNILTDQVFFFFALGIWLLYTGKVIYFFYQCLQKEAYDFLFIANAIPASRKFLHLFRLNTILLTPVGLYGLFIFIVSVKENKLIAGILILVTIVALAVAATIICLLIINKGKGIQQITGSWFPAIRLPGTLAGFVLRFVFRKQFAGILITKLLSFSILYLFAKTDSSLFEDRMLWLLFITALIGHSFIIYRNFHFIEHDLGFYRNMPVRASVSLLQLLIVYVVLLIPEAWALRGVIINQHNTADFIEMIVMGPFFLLLIHALLYTEDMPIYEFLKLLFGIWIIFIFFSMSPYHWLMSLISLFASVFIFYGSYRKYEKLMEIEGPE